MTCPASSSGSLLGPGKILDQLAVDEDVPCDYTSKRAQDCRPEGGEGMTERRTIGIDVAAARPCTCVLADGLVVQEWLETRDLDELASWVLCHQPDVIAVDAPCATSKGLLLEPEAGAKPYGGRKCDHELRRRSIPLYEVPRERAQADPWMEVGFQIFELLGQLGYRLPVEAGTARSVIEVYPFASFVTLLGGTPAKKSTAPGQAQRLEVLRRHGLSWDGRFDHDALDALVAALTAIKFLEGGASPVGDREEALLWLPVDQPEDTYSRLPASSTRVELPELEHLHLVLSPEGRDDLLQCLLIAAPGGGEAMIKVNSVERSGEVRMVDAEEVILSFGPFGVSVCDGPYGVFKWQWQNVFLIELTDHSLRGTRRSRFRLLGRSRAGASFEIPYDTIISVKLSPHPARLGVTQVLDISYRDSQGVREKSIAAYNRLAESAFAVLQRLAPCAS